MVGPLGQTSVGVDPLLLVLTGRIPSATVTIRAEGRRGPIRVLVVDDEPDARLFIRVALGTDPDFLVCGEAVNGAEAVKLVSDLHPDVVLLDIRMPLMDGIDAARKLKSICPGTRL